MNKTMKETVRHYLVLRAVSTFGMSFISATYVVFLIAKGLNLFEVNLVNFIFFTTLFIFEIPTGAFADVFGRKLSFVISCLLLACSMFIYGFAKSFWGFALAEAMGAVGATFASGAFQAWLIDRLKYQGYSGAFSLIFAKEQQIKSGTGIIAAIFGAYLGSKSLSLPWFVGGFIFIAATCLVIIYMREEDEFVRQKFSFVLGIKSMAVVVKNGFHYGLENKAVKFILLLGVFQFFSVQAPNMQWQVFFGKFVNKAAFGFLFAGISVAMIVGSASASWFLKKIKDEKLAISISQIAIGIGICLTVFCNKFIPAITVFLFHEMARGVFNPLKDVYLNDNIPSEKRATLISFDSISHHIGGMMGLLVSGVLAQYLSLQVAWTFSGLVLVLSTLFLLKNGKKV